MNKSAEKEKTEEDVRLAERAVAEVERDSMMGTLRQKQSYRAADAALRHNENEIEEDDSGWQSDVSERRRVVQGVEDFENEGEGSVRSGTKRQNTTRGNVKAPSKRQKLEALKDEYRAIKEREHHFEKQMSSDGDGIATMMKGVGDALKVMFKPVEPTSVTGFSKGTQNIFLISYYKLTKVVETEERFDGMEKRMGVMEQKTDEMIAQSKAILDALAALRAHRQ